MIIALKSVSNGQFVTAWDTDPATGDHPLVANRARVGSGEAFEVFERLEDGTLIPLELEPVPPAPPAPDPPAPWVITGTGTAADPILTSPMDPAYLAPAITASYRGVNGAAIPIPECEYWIRHTDHAGQYSDGKFRGGWNAYQEERLRIGNDGSADVRLADQRARFLPTP